MQRKRVDAASELPYLSGHGKLEVSVAWIFRQRRYSQRTSVSATIRVRSSLSHAPLRGALQARSYRNSTPDTRNAEIPGSMISDSNEARELRLF